MTTTTTTDAKGRALSFKPLGLLDEMDLIEIAGDAASNARWMMIARLAVNRRRGWTMMKLHRAPPTSRGVSGARLACHLLGPVDKRDSETA